MKNKIEVKDKITLHKVVTYSWECPKCNRINHDATEDTKIGEELMCEGCCKSFKIGKIQD